MNTVKCKACRKKLRSLEDDLITVYLLKVITLCNQPSARRDGANLNAIRIAPSWSDRPQRKAYPESAFGFRELVGERADTRFTREEMAGSSAHPAWRSAVTRFAYRRVILSSKCNPGQTLAAKKLGDGFEKREPQWISLMGPCLPNEQFGISGRVQRIPQQFDNGGLTATDRAGMMYTL
jgi:hypothetical protein